MRRILDWLLYAQSGGQFHELIGITTQFAPPDPDAYRHYLPDPLGMPVRPLVKVFLIDYLRVAPWPFTRYREWTVLLRAAHDDGEGWYPVTMPVTTWIARQGGHHLGFPKYVTPSIELVDSDDGMRGRVSAPGRIDVTMDYRDGEAPRGADRDTRHRAHESILPDDLLVLKPVGVGPEVRRVRFREVAASTWTVRRGRVTLHGDAGNLLVQDRPLAASLHHFRGAMNLVADAPATLPFRRPAVPASAARRAA